MKRGEGLISLKIVPLRLIHVISSIRTMQQNPFSAVLRVNPMETWTRWIPGITKGGYFVDNKLPIPQKLRFDPRWLCPCLPDIVGRLWHVSLQWKHRSTYSEC